MSIRVNGQEQAAAPDQTVEALVEALGVPRRGIAVAVDGAVVPRSRWADARVPDGARVEIVTAVQGG